MRTGLGAVVTALLLLVVSAAGARADISDPGKPHYANNILGGFVTPVVAPGHTVDFSFNVSNPYDDPVAVMHNVSLVVGIYEYATQETNESVTADFPHPPLIGGVATQTTLAMGTLPLNHTVRVNLSIETGRDTPHGSYFSQSTYFVRFNMSFNFTDNATEVVLKSKGWFTDEEWDNIVSFENDQPIVNRTYLKELGIDGLLPDSSFGIKIPIPRWPLAVIVGLCVGLCFLAAYYYVLDNPGKYPKLEKRFYYLRGKLRESWSKLKNRRGK